MDLGLKNKVALVTGASKGIGRAIAMALAREGCRVCIVARSAAPLAAAADEIRQATGSEVLHAAADVSDAASIESMLARIHQHWGTVEVLVNNAGGPPPGSFLEHGEAVWQQTLDQNFLSVVRLSRAVAPAMKQKKWGRILNLTSTIAKEPTPAMVLSASTRAAVSAFTKAIAGELAPFNITVNTICPGGVQTERVASLMSITAQRENISVEEVVKRSVAMIPIQRFASAEEIAAIMVFLASEAASYVTGVSMMVDGGLTKSVF